MVNYWRAEGREARNKSLKRPDYFIASARASEYFCRSLNYVAVSSLGNWAFLAKDNRSVLLIRADPCYPYSLEAIYKFCALARFSKEVKEPAHIMAEMVKILLSRATFKKTKFKCKKCGAIIKELVPNEIYNCEECDEQFSLDELS